MKKDTFSDEELSISELQKLQQFKLQNYDHLRSNTALHEFVDSLDALGYRKYEISEKGSRIDLESFASLNELPLDSKIKLLPPNFSNSMKSSRNIRSHSETVSVSETFKSIINTRLPNKRKIDYSSQIHPLIYLAYKFMLGKVLRVLPPVKRI